MCEKNYPAASSESGMTDLRSQVQPLHGEKNPVPKCYPFFRGKPVYGGNKEAIGWTMVSVAMTINYVGVGAFFANPLLRIAENVLNCHIENADANINLNEVCGPAITFIKPSSLLTFYAMIIGSVSSCSLPFLGAFVDYTRHRLSLGRLTSALFTICLLPLMFLNKKNYIGILCCHAFSVFFSWPVTVFYFAYLPELTTDELQLADWTKCITMWSYLSMLAYLLGVIGGVYVLGKSEDLFFNVQFGMGLMFAIVALFLQIAWWFLFNKREPLHKIPEHSSLCSVAWKQLYKTGLNIKRNYRSLKWFYLYTVFANSAWQAFGIIILAYLTHVQQFTPLQTGIGFGCSLVGSIPGAMVASFITRKFDPINSARVNMVLIIVCVTGFAIILTGPDQQVRTYIYLVFVGFNGGWKFGVDRLISSSIIPESQSAEMMGFYLFSDQCILWVPLMVYTIMNETGVSNRVSVAVLDVYLCVSLVCLFMTGSYAEARAEVKRTTVYSGKGGIDTAIATAAAAANADEAAGEGNTEGTKDDNIVKDIPSPPTKQAHETIAEA